jgi:two-component system, cell cycle response regulator DivK
MPKRVLIVDDEEKNLRLVRDILAANGYLTSEATNGKEAVEIALNHPPDLILMDIQMPILDGLSAIKILKTNDSVKHIPIVALTAKSMALDQEGVMCAGADGYLRKPISIKNLLKSVKKHAEHLDISSDA